MVTVSFNETPEMQLDKLSCGAALSDELNARKGPVATAADDRPEYQAMFEDNYAKSDLICDSFSQLNLHATAFVNFM